MKKTRQGIWVLLFTTASFWGLPAQAMEVSTDAKTYYNRGTDSYMKGDFQAAVRDLSAAIVLEPKAPDFFYNRGLSYRQQHENDKALSDFSKAIELNQTAARYYFERCNVSIVKNDPSGAVADCSEGLRLSPDDASGYLMRGVAHMFRGDLEDALADTVQALEIEPDYLDARRLLYELLLKREIAVHVHSMPMSHRAYLSNTPKEI